VKGLGRHWSWRELVALDDAARAALPETPVEACMICDDGGGED
jgi:hypothetical protein